MRAARKRFRVLRKIGQSQFEQTGRLDWVSDLVEIALWAGVKNVYSDVGASFANCCIKLSASCGRDDGIAAERARRAPCGLGNGSIALVWLASVADRGSPAQNGEFRKTCSRNTDSRRLGLRMDPSRAES